MIYITGDCHGNFCRFEDNIFYEQVEMSKTDYVIICGDFGGVWKKDKEDAEEKRNLDWLEKRPFTTLFVDGNHENFDRLNAYPVEMWNGGKVHRIRPSVIHLMRGQVFDIDGAVIFAFGGASSHDISGGILDPEDPQFARKKKELNQGVLPFRIKNISWWENELPSKEEMAEGWKNLADHNYEVDFIVSHCCSSSTQALLSSGAFKPDRATDYLEEVRQRTKFKKWFFGHYHDNRYVNADEILLYEQIIRIW